MNTFLAIFCVINYTFAALPVERDCNLEPRALERPEIPSFSRLEPDEAGNRNFQVILQEGHVKLSFEDFTGNEWFATRQLNSLVTVIVRAEVREIKDLLVYTYSLENSSDSYFSVRRFVIGSEGLEVRQIVSADHWMMQLLPIDVWKRQLWSWFARQDASGSASTAIKVGEARSGFKLESTSYPSIVPCWAAASGKGTERGPGFNTEMPGPLQFYIMNHLLLLQDAAFGFTVGPGTEPPVLTSLRDYLRVSLNQGWVCEGIAHQRLSDLVEQALAEQEVENKEKLVDTLGTLAHEVEEYLHADPPQITTEVQALLGINAAWLRAQAEEELAEKSTPNQPAGDGSAP